VLLYTVTELFFGPSRVFFLRSFTQKQVVTTNVVKLINVVRGSYIPLLCP